MPKIEERRLGHFLEVLGLGDLFDPHALSFYRHLLRLDVEPLSRSPTAAKAIRAAGDRRQKINAFLGRETAGDIETQVPGDAPRQEFLETPPRSGFEGSRRGFENPGDAVGQKARLDWQINNVALLLADRVVDYVVHLRRQGVEGIKAVRLDCARDQQSSADAQLSAFDPILRQFGHIEDAGHHEYYHHYAGSPILHESFPWRVVIEVKDFYWATHHFNEDILDWLTIGIDLAPARAEPRPSSCTNSLEEGVVGGIFVHRTRPDQPYGLTCAHVVTPGCPCVVDIGWKGGGAPNTEVHEPDAALVSLGQPMGRFCTTAASGQLNNVLASEGPEASARLRPTTQLTPSARTMRHGVILTPLLGYNMQEKLFRVPSLDIKPYSFVSMLHFLRAPLRTTFSEPGDSGSWVTPVDADGTWYGMICANDRKYRSSFAIDSRFLRNYFAEKLHVAPGEWMMKALS